MAGDWIWIRRARSIPIRAGRIPRAGRKGTLTSTSELNGSLGQCCGRQPPRRDCSATRGIQRRPLTPGKRGQGYKRKGGAEGTAKFREETSKKADSAVNNRIAATHNIGQHACPCKPFFGPR